MTGGLVAGVLLVVLLVVPRRHVPSVLFLHLSALGASSIGVFAVAVITDRLLPSLLVTLAALVSLFFAYTASAVVLPRVTQMRPETEGASDQTRTGVTVILSACVEPETYRPSTLTETFAEYDASGVPLPSLLTRPMLYAAERARYRQSASFSPGRSTCRVVAEALQEALSDDLRVDGVETEWCRPATALGSLVSRAATEGARAVLVVQLAIAESLLMEDARLLVDRLDGLAPPVPVAYTPPLWGARSIAEMVVERVLDAAADRPRERVGVALVGHGQPEEWQAKHSAWSEHEMYFHHRVRTMLEDAGISDQNVRLAWLEWLDPDVVETVRHLAALDCELVLVVPASMPVETTLTLVDLRQAFSLERA